MRLAAPRIKPLSDAELNDDQKEALKPFGGRVLNIFRTLVHAPKALTRFNDWGGYILSRRNDLPPFGERVPYVAAVVDLDEGPRMMTNIVECPQTPEALVLDMPLEVVFAKQNDTITLPLFRPAKG